MKFTIQFVQDKLEYSKQVELPSEPQKCETIIVDNLKFVVTERIHVNNQETHLMCDCHVKVDKSGIKFGGWQETTGEAFEKLPEKVKAKK